MLAWFALQYGMGAAKAYCWMSFVMLECCIASTCHAEPSFVEYSGDTPLPSTFILHSWIDDSMHRVGRAAPGVEYQTDIEPLLPYTASDFFHFCSTADPSVTTKLQRSLNAKANQHSLKAAVESMKEQSKRGEKLRWAHHKAVTLKGAWGWKMVRPEDPRQHISDVEYAITARLNLDLKPFPARATQSKLPTLEKCPFPALKFALLSTCIHLSDCDMTATHSTPTHPSHHPPNTIPAPADAAQSAPQPSEESAPFTEVVGRGRKSRNAQSKRVAPQQTTLTFAGAPPPPPTSSPVVSVGIASRVEETKECTATSSRVDPQPAGRATASAATASIKETGQLDPLTSSSRATQHSSPSLPTALPADPATRAAQGEPLTTSSAAQHASSSSASPSLTLTSTSRPNGAEHDDDRMRDTAAPKRRARELDNAPTGPVAPVALTSNGFVHPARQHRICQGGETSAAADGSGKEEAHPSSGQDKRRRTTPTAGSTASSSSSGSARTARRDTPPTVEEFNNVVAELQASTKEASELRARLEQLERRVEALLSASPATAGVSPLTSTAVPARDNMGVAGPPTVVPSKTATATAETMSPPSTAPHNQRARQCFLAEPKAALLSSLSLPPYSTTDLMLDVCLPPLTINMARGRFPNHATQPANHRMGIVNLLQGANGIQLRPPRIPLFVTKARGEQDSITALRLSYAPDSREYRYLDGIVQADTNGDDYDPFQHSFTDAECVSTWHQLLTLDTRIVSSQHQRKLYIRLALLNPVLTAAVRVCVTAHMQHVRLSLAAWQTGRPATASRSGTTSPTPSVASTASSSSAEEQSPSGTSSMDGDAESPPNRRRGLAPLGEGAMHCVVGVSPFRQRYATCTISNWPRAHPTELCGSNSHLTAFFRQHAPDVRLVTREENGMTSGSVTAYCQQRHLSQLEGLNGRVSEEHGIHFPLRLHTSIHVMGAKTCTFCWQPNHGATHCPRRTSSGSADQPPSTRPACRPLLFLRPHVGRLHVHYHQRVHAV